MDRFYLELKSILFNAYVWAWITVHSARPRTARIVTKQQVSAIHFRWRSVLRIRPHTSTGQLQSGLLNSEIFDLSGQRHPPSRTIRSRDLARIPPHIPPPPPIPFALTPIVTNLGFRNARQKTAGRLSQPLRGADHVLTAPRPVESDPETNQSRTRRPT